MWDWIGDLASSAYNDITSWLGINNSESRAYDRQVALQEDQQAFNSVEAEKGRQFQEEFYTKHQSAEAKYNEFKNLGASENAAVMAALGAGQGSGSSAPTASSGLGSSPASMVGSGANFLKTIMDSFESNENRKKIQEEAQNIASQTEWMPLLNQANIDNMIGRLQLDNKRFNFDQKVFEDVQKPLAYSTIGKNSAEVSKMSEETKKINQEINEIIAKINLMKKQGQNIDADIVLKGAQTDLAGAHANLAFAQTGLVGAQQTLTESQTEFQNLSNRLKTLTVELSEELGANIEINPLNNAIAIGGKFIGHNFTELVEKPIGVTLGRIKQACKFKEYSKFAKDKTEKFVDDVVRYGRYIYPGKGIINILQDLEDGKTKLPKFSPEYQSWLKHRGKKFSEFHDWINRNTMYGYN